MGGGALDFLCDRLAPQLFPRLKIEEIQICFRAISFAEDQGAASGPYEPAAGWGSMRLRGRRGIPGPAAAACSLRATAVVPRDTRVECSSAWSAGMPGVLDSLASKRKVVQQRDVCTVWSGWLLQLPRPHTVAGRSYGGVSGETFNN